jgi:hypothetical protein
LPLSKRLSRRDWAQLRPCAGRPRRTGAPPWGLDDCRMILRFRGYSPCRGSKHCFNATFSTFFSFSFSFASSISLIPALPGAFWHPSVADAFRALSLYFLRYVTAIHPPTHFSFFPVDFMPIGVSLLWPRMGPLRLSTRLLVAVNKCCF